MYICIYARIFTYMHMYLCISVNMYMCICVCIPRLETHNAQYFGGQPRARPLHRGSDLLIQVADLMSGSAAWTPFCNAPKPIINTSFKIIPYGSILINIREFPNEITALVGTQQATLT